MTLENKWFAIYAHYGILDYTWNFSVLCTFVLVG